LILVRILMVVQIVSKVQSSKNRWKCKESAIDSRIISCVFGCIAVFDFILRVKIGLIFYW